MWEAAVFIMYRCVLQTLDFGIFRGSTKIHSTFCVQMRIKQHYFITKLFIITTTTSATTTATATATTTTTNQTTGYSEKHAVVSMHAIIVIF
jgi:hypothetical protein